MSTVVKRGRGLDWMIRGHSFYSAVWGGSFVEACEECPWLMVWLSPQSWSCSRSRPLFATSCQKWAGMLIPFLCLIICPISCPSVYRFIGLGADSAPSFGQLLSLGMDPGLCVSTDAGVILWAFQVSLPAGLGASCKLGKLDQIYLEWGSTHEISLPRIP